MDLSERKEIGKIATFSLVLPEAIRKSKSSKKEPGKILASVMRSLSRESDHQLLISRLRAVSPQDTAHWGRMNVYQMMHHVSDALRVTLGEIKVGESGTLFHRTLMKWGALWVPTHWPKNVPTRPEIDQCLLDKPTGDMSALKADALHQLARLCQASLNGVRHPFMGTLNQKEWMRWGWLHTDHHLRQFGR